MAFPLKILKGDLPWPHNPTPGHISRKDENSNFSKIHALQFIAALFTIARKGNNINIPTNRWMDRGDVIYIYTHTQWNITKSWKEWSNAICSNMDGPRNHHIRWSKSDGERQVAFYITSMWNLKRYNWMYFLKRNRLTDIENIQWLPEGIAGGGRR